MKHYESFTVTFILQLLIGYDHYLVINILMTMTFFLTKSLAKVLLIELSGKRIHCDNGYFNYGLE